MNTYNEFVRLLEYVRTVVRKEKAISAQNLAKKFAKTALAKAADLARWEEWRAKFAARELTAKNAALVLLKDTTLLEIPSLKSKLSRTRKSKKRAKRNSG